MKFPKPFSKPIASAVMVLVAAGSLASAGSVASALFWTDPQDIDFGEGQTDFSAVRQAELFYLPDFGADELAAVRINLSAIATAGGEGSFVKCARGDANGRCSGAVNGEVVVSLTTEDLSEPLAVVIPLATFDFDLAEGDFTDPLPFFSDFATTGDITLTDPEILSAFTAASSGETTDLTCTGDGTIITTTNTGSALVDTPLTVECGAPISFGFLRPDDDLDSSGPNEESGDSSSGGESGDSSSGGESGGSSSSGESGDSSSGGESGGSSSSGESAGSGSNEGTDDSDSSEESADSSSSEGTDDSGSNEGSDGFEVVALVIDPELGPTAQVPEPGVLFSLGLLAFGGLLAQMHRDEHS